MNRRINRFWTVAAVLLSTLLLWPTFDLAQGHGTGLILPTEEELRSVPLVSTPFSGIELPIRADLSPDFPPPGSQGIQNSCVAWTLAYSMKSYQERKEEGNNLVTTTGQPDYNYIFSPAFIYNQLNYGRDGGCHMHDALNLLQEKGVCTWSDMPYSTYDYKQQPSIQALTKAKRYRIDTWRRVNIQSIREVKTQIQAGYPVIIGAMIDEGFERYDNPPDWIWKHSEGAVKFAHAMLVVGYDDSRTAFKVINSWGKKWGDGGYGWIDYNHFRKVVRAGYVTKDARNSVTPVIPSDSRNSRIDLPPFDAGLQFRVTNINYNASYPNRPDLGYFLRIDGRLRIPGSVGRTNQVVIHFYHQLPDGRIGQQVPSDIVEYRDINGYAACGTAIYSIPIEGLDTGFSAWISNSAFSLPMGQWYQTQSGPKYQYKRSYLFAVPTLFVDNFGVAKEQPISLYVDK
jgi:hypothetical protein